MPQLFRDQKVAVEFYNPQPNVFGQLIPLLLPVVLIIAFFVWMQRRAAGQMGNVMSIGRSRAKAYSADKPSTTFADIAGYEGVKQEIKEVVDFLQDARAVQGDRRARAQGHAAGRSAGHRQDALRPGRRR